MQQKQSDALQAYIKEADEYNSKLFSKMQGMLHAKPDYEILENFQRNVNEKVLKELVSKIDREEHKRIQNTMRKKLNHLEKEVEDLYIKNIKDEGYKSPFLVTNNKWFSWNRVKEDSPEQVGKNTTDLSSAKNKYIFKELYNKGPKVGASFSRILNKLDKPDTVSAMTKRDASHQIIEETPKKSNYNTDNMFKMDSREDLRDQKNTYVTPKVDLKSKSSTNFNLNDRPSAFNQTLTEKVN